MVVVWKGNLLPTIGMFSLVSLFVFGWMFIYSIEANDNPVYTQNNQRLVPLLILVSFLQLYNNQKSPAVRMPLDTNIFPGEIPSL